MIRVTVELFPHGSEEGKKTLTIFDIANDGTGTPERGNYVARKSPKDAWGPTIVVDYPRQAYHVRELLLRVLQAWKIK